VRPLQQLSVCDAAGLSSNPPTPSLTPPKLLYDYKEMFVRERKVFDISHSNTGLWFSVIIDSIEMVPVPI
jgi:hypothetical protein